MLDPDIAIGTEVGTCVISVIDDQIIQFLKKKLDENKDKIINDPLLAPIADILSSDNAKIQPACFDGLEKIGIERYGLLVIRDRLWILPQSVVACRTPQVPYRRFWERF